MITNVNIKPVSTIIDPTIDLNDALNAFDAIIAETFGEEVARIKHELWSERVSLSSVKFANGDYIGFRITANTVCDDTYNASREHLRKAFMAFNLVIPGWLYC